jgi:uncharacterized membrane protein YgaE (UPF0421/DUF939 family)
MHNAMLLARRARDSRLKLLGARFAPRAKIVGGLSQGLLSAAAGILAYLPTKPLGLQEGFWASITAIALIQSEPGATRNSARDQFAGAAIGGLTSAAIVSLAGQSLVAYALAVLVSVMACWVFNVSSAARLAGSTATIIALVPHHGKVEWMVMSRITEVVWGVAVGIGIMWLVNRFETLRAKPKSVTKDAAV